MVSHGRRNWRGREEVPREFREHHSLERSIWGTCHLSLDKRRRIVFDPLTETIGACVQEDRLWIADPKAINHILHKSGYLYAKPSEIQEQSAIFIDRGIASVEGEFRTTSVLACFWLIQRCCRRST